MKSENVKSVNLNRDRIIKIIALKKQYKQEGKPFLTIAIPDPENHWKPFNCLTLYTDWEQLDDVTKNAALDTLSITDGQTLDLSNDYDLLIYLRCVITPEVALSLKTKKREHLFYLHDEEQIANENSERANSSYEAFKIIDKLNDEEKKDLAMYLGKSINGLKQNIINSYIFDIAMKDAGRIIEFDKLDNKDNIIFCHKLIRYNICKRTKDGYFHDKNYLGETIQGMMANIFKKENAGTLSKLTKELFIIENPGSPKAKEVINQKIDEGVNASNNEEIEKLKLQNTIKDLKFDYFKLALKEYEGPESIADIELAISVQTDINEFLEKSKEWDEAKLVTNLKQRKVSEDKFKDVEDKEGLIEVVKQSIIDKHTKN